MASPHLDHIIILISYHSLSSLPTYFTDNFIITPGGRHADNKTENKLICFQDGSYIELIAFINDDPAHRKGHWWGNKKLGIVDFAFTHAEGDAAVHFSELERRLESLKLQEGVEDVGYQAPVAGGRRRPDGVDVKWEVAFPIVGCTYQRGELPFWCHDVTPREMRVPFTKANTTHPCGSTGVSELCIFVPEERVPVLLKAYSAILASAAKGASLEVAKLKPVGDVQDDTRFVVAAPEEEWQKTAMQERGGYLIGNLYLGNSDSGKGKEKEKHMRRVDGAAGGFGIGGLWI